MTIDEIKELIQVVNETGIAQLEVQRGEHRVMIVRAVAATQERGVPVSTALPLAVGLAPVVSSSAAPGFPQLEPASTISAAQPIPAESEKDMLVHSPIVGTYYDAPSPDAPKFVKVGDRVEPKQVLCIIESMKLMNEIEAEVAGIVMAKHVDNGRPVEYGELLFTVRPARL